MTVFAPWCTKIKTFPKFRKPQARVPILFVEHGTTQASGQSFIPIHGTTQASGQVSNTNSSSMQASTLGQIINTNHTDPTRVLHISSSGSTHNTGSTDALQIGRISDEPTLSADALHFSGGSNSPTGCTNNLGVRHPQVLNQNTHSVSNESEASINLRVDSNCIDLNTSSNRRSECVAKQRRMLDQYTSESTVKRAGLSSQHSALGGKGIQAKHVFFTHSA